MREALTRLAADGSGQLEARRRQPSFIYINTRAKDVIRAGRVGGPRKAVVLEARFIPRCGEVSRNRNNGCLAR